MKILYIEPYCGVAGDMLNAGLLGLEGAPSLDSLIERLLSVPFEEEWDIQLSEVTRHTVTAKYFNVMVKGDSSHHRNLNDISLLIQNAGKFSDKVKKKAIAVFGKLAEAEALVHGTTTDKVHFHEVGAVDAVIDIMSCCYILDEISPDFIYSSKISLGTGSVSTVHGELPVPVPATVNLIKNIPVNYTDIESELATPTGCALLSVLVDEWKKPSGDMMMLSVAYGAGSRDLKERASVLRVSLLESIDSSSEISLNTDTIAVIETNIDDMTPEAVGALQTALLDAGVLDCTVSSVFMKKQRPAFFIKIITLKDDFRKIAKLLLKETSAIGVRYRFEDRIILDRNVIRRTTTFGDVEVKVSFSNDNNIEKFKVEYESCLELAKNYDLSYWEMEKKINTFLNDFNVCEK
jgi:uncharacterized protein (TIGR00299 family) protein